MLRSLPELWFPVHAPTLMRKADVKSAVRSLQIKEHRCGADVEQLPSEGRILFQAAMPHLVSDAKRWVMSLILYELLSSGFYIAVYCWVGAQHCAIRVFKSVLSPQESWIHPWSLAWNLKMTPVEKEIPFGNYHFKFYLEIWACIRMILLFVWWGTRPTHASLRQTVAVLQACRDVLCGQRWWFKQIDMFEDGVGFITGNRIFKGFMWPVTSCNHQILQYLDIWLWFMILWYFMCQCLEKDLCVCVSSRFRLY